MGWIEDGWNAITSGVAAVGDAVEGVIETATDTVENVVDAVTNTVEEGVDAATDWVVQTVPLTPFGKGVVNLLVGVVDAAINSVITVFREVVDGYLHIQKAIGKIIGSILRLDLPGLVQGVLDIFIGSLEVALALFQYLTLGTFFGKLVNSFQRNMLKDFVEKLLSDEFSGKRLESVRKRLNMDSSLWGLTCNSNHKVFKMDSRTFPLASLHNNQTLDLFGMAGVISIESFPIFTPRYTIKYITSSGVESVIPATRYHISQFLKTGKPDLVVYAMDGSELRNSLDFANRHFRQAAIRFNWNERIIFPRQHTPVSFDLSNAPEYSMTINGVPLIDTFLNTSGIKPVNEDDLTIRAQTSFNLLFFKTTATGTTSSNFNGITTGRFIAPSDTTCSNVLQPFIGVDATGAGVTTRNVYPNYFSKVVLAHELGHYFGLCHVGHDGVQNIMFSNADGNSILDIGLLNYYMRSEPDFSFDDKKNMWTFIVKTLGSQL